MDGLALNSFLGNATAVVRWECSNKNSNASRNEYWANLVVSLPPFRLPPSVGRHMAAVNGLCSFVPLFLTWVWWFGRCSEIQGVNGIAVYLGAA